MSRAKGIAVVGVAVLGVGAGVAFSGAPERIEYAPQSITVKESDGKALVTIRRSNCQSEGVIAYYSISHPDNHGTATQFEDYEPRVGEHVFGPCHDLSSQEVTIEVPIVDDDVYEGDETIIMSLDAARPKAEEKPAEDEKGGKERADEKPGGDPAPEPDLEVVPDGYIVIEDDDPKPPVEEEPQPPKDRPKPKPTPPLDLTTAPKIDPPPQQRSVSPRAAKKPCTSRRVFSIKLRSGGDRIVSSVVKVDGRPTRTTFRSGRSTALVDLRSRPAGRVVVTVLSRTASGGTVREVRRYRTCAKNTRRSARPT